MSAVKLYVAPEPLSLRTEQFEVCEGLSIRELLAEACNQGALAFEDVGRTKIYINGELINVAASLHFVPPAGSTVNFAVDALGGGEGQSDTSKTLQTILTIAIIAISIWVPGASGPLASASQFVRAATTAAIQIGGTMAINALFAPNIDELANANDRYALQGASNQFRPRANMPLILGKQRVGFDLAAKPYTEFVGDDSWYHVILGVHYGPCSVNNIKIGETFLADYPSEDIQIDSFLSPGVRDSFIYPGRVVQEDFTDLLDKGGAWEVHTTATNAERIELDFGWPNGLRFNKDNGKILPQEVQIEVQWAPVGSGTWTAAPFTGYVDRLGFAVPTGNAYFSGRTNDPVRRTVVWNVPVKGQYDIRVRCFDPDADDPERTTDKTYWTALRTKENVKPIVDQNLSVIFLRIKASNDLNGTFPTVTGEVEPICPIWNGSNWSISAPTSNAAALARWLLTGPAAAKPADYSEIHSSFADGYELIEEYDWKGSIEIKDEMSQEDALRALGRMGRFVTYHNGSQLVLVSDWEKPVPRQLFTGRNAQGYRYKRTFPEEIHAVFIEFKNTDENSAVDELTVYADGYSSTTATLIETMRIDFACTLDRAFREGRVYLAKRQLQVESHEWSAGADSIVATLGDRVRVSHPSILFGKGSGRVLYRHMSGGLVTGIRIDNELKMEAGKSYAIDARRGSVVLTGLPLTTVVGKQRSLTFAVPLAEADAPRKGDLLSYGEAGIVTEDLEIIDITPGQVSTISARLYAAEAIMAAETGPIPPLQTTIKPIEPTPQPMITGTNASTSGVEVVFTVPPVYGPQIEGFYARWRYTPDGDEVSNWNSLEQYPASARSVKTPPIDNAQFIAGTGEIRVDVEIITSMRSGASSAPAKAYNILVVQPVLPPSIFVAQGEIRAAPDGSSRSVLYVYSTMQEAGDIQFLDVEIKYTTLGADSYRAPGQPLPALNPSGDYLNVEAGRRYDVRGRWRNKDGWFSTWVYDLNVLIPEHGNVASDVITVGGRPSEDLLQEVADAQTAADNAQDAADAARDVADDALTQLEDPTSGALVRIDRLSSKGKSVNPNGDFKDWNNTALPTYVVIWNSGTASRFTGISGEEISLTVAGGVEGGFAWGASANGTPLAGRWYTVEVDFTLVSGSLDGAGLYLYTYGPPGTTTYGEKKFAFKEIFGAGTADRPYKYRSAPFKLGDNALMSGLVFHVMNHWTGFDDAYDEISVANTIRWARAELLVATGVESSWDETVFIATNAAARVTTLETQTQIRPNLLKNSDGSEAQTVAPFFPKYFDGATDFFGRGYDNKLGSYFYTTANTSGSGKVLTSYGYDIEAGSTISISLYGDGGEDYATPGQQAYVYINFRNASTGAWDLDSTTVNPAWRVIMDDRTWLKWYKLPNVVVPAGKNGWRFVYAIPDGHAGSSFSRIMVNFGPDCVAYNNMATQVDSVARIRQTEITQSDQTTTIANLTTSVGASRAQSDSLVANSRFGAYTNSPGIPDYWGNWANGTGTRQTGRGANYAYQVDIASGADQGIYQTIRVTPGKYVINCEVECISGDYSGAGVWLDNLAAYSDGLDFIADPDDSGVTTPGGGSGGTVRRFSKVVTVTVDGTYNLYAMGNWSSWGHTRTAKTLKWFRVSLDPLDMPGRVAYAADANASTALTAVTSPTGSLAVLENKVDSNYSSLAKLADSPTVNPRFAAYAAPTGIPDGWSDWVSGGSGVRVPGVGGSYAYKATTSLGVDQGLVQTLYLTPGRYVLYGEAWVEAGDWRGAGLHINGVTTTPSGRDGDSLRFAVDPDIAGGIGAGAPGIRRFSKIVDIASAGNANLYLMSNWSGFGDIPAKTIHWFRAEIAPLDAGGQAAIDAQADASTALYALTDPAGSFALYQTSVNARFTSPTGEVELAKSGAISTAQTNTDNAIATYDATVSTSYGGLAATASASLTVAQTADGKVNLGWGIRFNVGGRITGGIKLSGTGEETAFDIEADYFRVWNGTSNIPAFQVSGGSTYVQDLHVKTSSIVPQSVYVPSIAVAPSSVSQPPDGMTLVEITGIVMAAGQTVDIQFSCDVGYPSVRNTITMRLNGQRTGDAGVNLTSTVNSFDGNDTVSMNIPWFFTATTAGTYRFWVWITGTRILSGNVDCSVANATLKANLTKV